MRKGRVCVAVTGIFVLLGFLAMGASAQAQNKVIKLRYSAHSQIAHHNGQRADEWCREIEKRTSGRVKITFFPGGSLVPATQTYDSVVKGVIDIGQTVLAWTPGRMPLSEVLDLPIGYKNGLQASRLADAYFRKFNPKELAGAKVLYLHAHGPGVYHTKAPVKVLDDLKAMRLKCTGTQTQFVQAIGAVPVSMPTGDMYDALQKGLLDGTALTMESLSSLKVSDHCKYTYQNDGTSFTTAFFVVMNKDRWNSLPQDIQKIFEEVSKEWVDKSGNSWVSADNEAQRVARAQGHRFVVASKEDMANAKKKMKPILNDYVKRMKAKGLPGKEALEFCLNYITTNP